MASGRSKWCSCKRSTVLICGINIFVALYVLHTLYTSLYFYPYSDSPSSFKYTAEQIRKMEESIQIRISSEPSELIRLVNQLRNDYVGEEEAVKLPLEMKLMIIDEISARLRGLKLDANATEQREAVESWRRQKLRKARKVIHAKSVNSSISVEAADVLLKALKSDWPTFSEEIGLWIPVEITHTEHDDKPEGEGEFEEEILPGRKLPPECHVELHTDYGGAAVKWGPTHPKDSAYECCMDCLNQAKNAKPEEKKCNIWVYCPSETGCYSPDKYVHKNQECWLKYAERPRVTFKDKYSETFRNSHPNAPLVVPWVSGVVNV